MPNGFDPEGCSWGYAGPYTRTYAEFLEGYAGPIKVTHPNGQSKTIIAERGQCAIDAGMSPSDQDVEKAVIAALEELGALPALIPWGTYLPYIVIGGIVVTGLVLWLRKK